MKKKFVGLLSCALVLCMALTPAFATETVTVGPDVFAPVVDAMTGQISPATVVSVVAAVIGVCVGLVFTWWAVRKVSRAIMSAFRKGKLSV